MKRVALLALLPVALTVCGCTAIPGLNMTDGALYGAAMGCGMGALITAPMFGAGCPMGAIAGAMMGSAVGIASTTAAPLPSSYFPVYPYP